MAVEGKRSERVAFVLPDLRGGGAERVLLTLAGGFRDAGFQTDIVVRTARGELLDQVHEDARLVELGSSRMATAVPALRRYLRASEPVAAISALAHANLSVLAAGLGLPSLRIVVTEHSHLSLPHAETRVGRSLVLPFAMRRLYPRARAVVAVSQGVADDVRRHLGAACDVKVVANPVDVQRLQKLAASEVVRHPWLVNGGPIILSVGRLSADKDFETLIRAFALLGTDTSSRLIILGEGEERAAIEQLAVRLGVSARVSLPGYTSNPYPYFKRASVFALSSIHEGLPLALLEAVALGVPSVATDCPSGPREILDEGRHGVLVPVGDPLALSVALARALGHPMRPGSDALDRYDLAKVVSEYAALIGRS